MKKEMVKVFQVATVFIGTIVGAGLASGKEITEFFTQYGISSFIGIIGCGIFYILISSIISRISINYNLSSYSDVMNIISPNIFGKITGFITTLFLISSASIILAGSGALIHQFFGIPKIIGSLIMIVIAIFFLLRDTEGLIEVNSFIVPGLICTLTLITVLYFAFCRNTVSLDNIASFPKQKTGILISTVLYAGYNTLSASGVLVPLSTQMKKSKIMIAGIVTGAIGLTILCLMINLLLTINQPYIYKYEIPLLFVANRFGNLIQALLLVIIWLEMFSTEVSDIYSISKTLEQTFNIKFKKAIFIVISLALLISQFGFGTLITKLYPIFGLLSLIFIFQCILFFFKHKKDFSNTAQIK
ncbi:MULTISPECIES: transporter [Clostridium]|uniref:Transporter n=1 Tax=Clostridium beijerinckii TaxID=1520 RepID=A0A1S9MZ76_CLOBE|nr:MULTISPECIES: transporter [Clostridium]MBN7574434.1 transporter [Clostridium beijerinckii]MBN7579488.1 transporter [Clostridium beijerinckii]MBN7584285.1 transporter [Clostridium beijerinckii]MBO0520865.1 transporter [Clostridium beijerinckii]MZK50834.1 transporter [Clostridium beijerinckii]